MPRQLRPLTLLPLLLLPLTGLAACARDDAAPSGSAQPSAAAPADAAPLPAPAAEASDPCSLLTAEKIREATGVAPAAGQAGSGVCTWAAADGSNPRLANLVLQHGAVTRRQWLSGGGSERDIVPGVGDVAVRVGSQLQAYRGGWLVGVTVKGVDRRGAAVELARAAPARLGG